MSADLAAAPEAATHCAYCALQCPTVLRDEGDTVAVRPADPDGGGLCQKGWTAPRCSARPTGCGPRWCAAPTGD